tara:strand:- start:21324 stop:21863 length:540 start_codon:yes stop_codon:yes gene_type:complete
MKNIITSLIIILIITSNSFSQEQKEQKSKMLDFTSKTGIIIKFEDYKLLNIKSTYGFAESKIRKVIAGNEVEYFYQISKSGKYDTKTASIAYEDLIEIQKALSNLKIQSEKDISSTSDYLENKFITDDGFKIGYYVSKEKIVWYMKLEKYGSDNTFFAKDYESIEVAFQAGKQKIEELR